MQRFVIRMSWPPKGRARHGHAYLYLVLADTNIQAVERVKLRWRGLQGGADSNRIEVLGTVETDLFDLQALPPELR